MTGTEPKPERVPNGLIVRRSERKYAMQEYRIKLNNTGEVREFVRAAERCPFDIDVYYNHIFVDGKSILGMMGLDLGQTLNVRCNGSDEAFEAFLREFPERRGDVA